MVVKKKFNNKLAEMLVSKGASVISDKKNPRQRIQISLQMPYRLLEKLDDTNNESWMTRTGWILKAIEERLERLEREKRLEQIRNT